MSAERIIKEVRTLLPAWGCVLGLVIMFEVLSLHYDAAANAGVALSFIAGCAMLAALSFGTEYDSKTLMGLLAQPLPRNRIWHEKIFVLLVALILLCFLAGCTLTLIQPRVAAGGVDLESLASAVIVPICALGGAPLLAMLTRSTLFSAVLAVFVPMFLLIGAVWGLEKLHVQWSDDASFWFRIGFLAVYACAMYALGFLKFTRLQMVESQNVLGRFSFTGRLPWSRSNARQSVKIERPVFKLARKEFNLQSISFLAALAFSIGWLSYRLLGNPRTITADTVDMAFNCYVPVMLVIIGAYSIAGERSLGTIPWQLTLPISRYNQWLVKLTIVGVTSLLLAILVPLIVSLDATHTFGQWLAGDSRDYDFTYEYFCVWLLFVAMFASSICNTPVRSVIMTIGLLVLCLTIYGLVSYYLSQVHQGPPHYEHLPPKPVPPDVLAKARHDVDWITKLTRQIFYGSLCASTLVNLAFSFLNYRQLTVGRKRMYVQTAVLLGIVALTTAVLSELSFKLSSSRAIIQAYEHDRQIP